MATITCPACGNAFDPESIKSVPFCSERCRYVDLGHWLDEEYGLAIEREEGEAGEDSF